MNLEGSHEFLALEKALSIVESFELNKEHRLFKNGL